MPPFRVCSCAPPSAFTLGVLAALRADGSFAVDEPSPRPPGAALPEADVVLIGPSGLARASAAFETTYPIERTLEALQPWMDSGLAPGRVVVLALPLSPYDAAALLAKSVGGAVAPWMDVADVLATCLAVAKGDLARGRARLVRAAQTASPGGEDGLEPHRPTASAGLTPREREVLALVAEGYRNRAVAERLFLAEGSVRNLLSRTYERIGATSRVEAVLWALQNGVAGE